MAAAAPLSPAAQPEDDRAYWTAMARRLAGPVLTHLAAGTLKRAMPVECATGNPAERARYTHLEALGRLLCGLAPWLESGDAPDLAAQARGPSVRRSIRSLPTSSISTKAANRWSIAASSPKRYSARLANCGSPWSRAQGEPGCGAGLFARHHARLQQLAALLRHHGGALALMGERWDTMRIDYALRQHQQWYKGDGVYGDGPQFHWDYYNSFVIQPMLIDVCAPGAHAHRAWDGMRWLTRWPAPAATPPFRSG